MAETSPRNHRRFNLSLPLWVHIRQRRREKALAEGKSEVAEEDVSEETTTTNISSAGCFFYLSRKPPLGAPVILEIKVPPLPQGSQTGKILCHGKVVRVSDQKVDRKVGVACTIHSYAFNPTKLR